MLVASSVARSEVKVVRALAELRAKRAVRSGKAGGGSVNLVRVDNRVKRVDGQVTFECVWRSQWRGNAVDVMTTEVRVREERSDAQRRHVLLTLRSVARTSLRGLAPLTSGTGGRGGRPWTSSQVREGGPCSAWVEVGVREPRERPQGRMGGARAVFSRSLARPPFAIASTAPERPARATT